MKKKINKLKGDGRVSITLLPDEDVVLVSQERPVLEELLGLKLDIDHSCGGMGSCGTCRVFVEQGQENISPRSELEREIAKERGFSKNERLCCQFQAVQGLAIRRPQGKFSPRK